MGGSVRRGADGIAGRGARSASDELLPLVEVRGAPATSLETR
jgi:hypothetical protein